MCVEGVDETRLRHQQPRRPTIFFACGWEVSSFSIKRPDHEDQEAKINCYPQPPATLADNLTTTPWSDRRPIYLWLVVKYRPKHRPEVSKPTYKSCTGYLIHQSASPTRNAPTAVLFRLAKWSQNRNLARPPDTTYLLTFSRTTQGRFGPQSIANSQCR